MEDLAALAKAKRELEELYLGVPDESVNLTFQYLAISPEQKKSGPKGEGSSPLTKFPSPDFKRALEESAHYHHHDDNSLQASRGRDHGNGENHHRDHAVESGMAYDSVSVMSSMSMASMSPYEEGGGRRRPGIPHSNICTICSVYIYIFRHRCLIHTQGRTNKVLYEVPKSGEAARAQVGRERTQEERQCHDVEIKKSGEPKNTHQGP
ncbi:hypothetical protein F0562_021597 [Nyssa sinensis]|uniref:Uncharacterized protein n=1 Tax=Nyssa sinensis TaxID=561372 RepID=A0A5J5BPE1_9ASTE|nr:hypothetical protein F0562_021597 [Nyssa sinensis]